MAEDRTDADIESHLRGNTLRVYWLILSEGRPVGVREIQRRLGMSSPSVASHHLNKLEELQLVERLFDGSYQLKALVKVGVLRSFMAVRGVLLPRYVFYSVFFTICAIGYMWVAFQIPPCLFDRLMVISVCLLAALSAWYESIRLWRLRFA